MDFIFKAAKSRNTFWPICLCVALSLIWAASLSAQEKTRTSSKARIQVEFGPGIGGIFPFFARFSAGVSLKGLGFEASYMRTVPELLDLAWAFSADFHMNVVPGGPNKSINPFFFLGIFAGSDFAVMNFGGGVKSRPKSGVGARLELRVLVATEGGGGSAPLVRRPLLPILNNSIHARPESILTRAGSNLLITHNSLWGDA